MIVLNPDAISVGQVLSMVRDGGLIVGVLTIVWKARGWLEASLQFLDRVTKHMAFVEATLTTLTTNHLRHIQQDLHLLARDRDHYAVEINESLDKFADHEDFNR